MQQQEPWIITKVEAQRRHPHRFNIYVNDEYAFALHEDVVVKFRLVPGFVLDEALRQRMEEEEEQGAAYRYAIRYIGRAMRSVKEIQDKLNTKGYSNEAIAAAIRRIQDQRYADDEAYAAALARQRLHTNRKGSLWIRRELAQKGIRGELADQALSQFDAAEETEAAMQLAVKRWKQMSGDDAAKLRRVIGLLQRRGFRQEAVRAVLDRLRQAETVDIDDGLWHD